MTGLQTLTLAEREELEAFSDAPITEQMIADKIRARSTVDRAADLRLTIKANLEIAEQYRADIRVYRARGQEGLAKLFGQQLAYYLERITACEEELAALQTRGAEQEPAAVREAAE